ncbi:MAG: molybdate ABC transporter substrate-binding protein [Halioglobus sp.]
MTTLIAATLLALTLEFPTAQAANSSLHIGVAANFRPAIEHLAIKYEQQSGNSIVISTASSGALYSQAFNGAPFDLVLSADQRVPVQLAAALKLTSTPFCYAIGQLVLLGGNIEDLANPGMSLAIANPTTAPYGAAAEEVIARSRFSAGTSRKLVRGGSALQAYQFWKTGNVNLALVPRSLSLMQGVAIPPDWHQPIAQFGIALSGSAEVADFLQWLTSNNTRQAISKLGYRTCS